jgi:hypothetical protein
MRYLDFKESEHMNKCIIFDSNFLYENKDLKKLFDLKKDDEDFYVTDLVIDEIKARNDRTLKDMHNKFSEIVNSNLNQVYLKLKNNIDIEKIYVDSSKKIQEYFESFFKENIIYGYSKDKMYDDLMERVRFKKAPFFDQENSSDKGFKDSLIWMSILFYVSAASYTEYLIVTNDKGFLKKQREALIEEFNTCFADNKLNIINNNEFMKTHIAIEEDDVKDDKKNNPIITEKKPTAKRIPEQLVKEAKSAVYSFFYYTVYGNPYNYEEHDENRFVLNRRPTYDEVIDFIDSLIEIRDDYTFHDQVELIEIFKDLGYKYVNQRESLEINVFNDFINMFVAVKNEFPENLDALVKYCIDNFCEVKNLDLEIEEDLPF